MMHIRIAKFVISVMFVGLVAPPAGGAAIGGWLGAIKPATELDASLTRAVWVGAPGIDTVERISCNESGACLVVGSTAGDKVAGQEFTAFTISSSLDSGMGHFFGGMFGEIIEDAVPTRDGGMLILGLSNSMFFTPMKSGGPTSTRPLLVELAADGKRLWSATLNDEKVVLECAIRRDDGSTVLVGLEKSAALVGTLDSQHSKLSFSRLAVQGSIDVHIHDCASLEGGDVLIVGSVSFKEGEFSPLIMRVASDGSPRWTYRMQLGTQSKFTAVAVTGPSQAVLYGSSWKKEDKLRQMLVAIDGDGGVSWAFEPAFPTNLSVGINKMIAFGDGVMGFGYMGVAQDNTPFGVMLQAGADGQSQRFFTVSQAGRLLIQDGVVTGDGTIRIAGHGYSPVPGMDPFIADWHASPSVATEPVPDAARLSLQSIRLEVTVKRKDYKLSDLGDRLDQHGLYFPLETDPAASAPVTN